MLLRVIYDQYIKGNKKCAITYIDFTAAFDSVSYRFLDVALEKAHASRKTRAMFRAIYEAVVDTTRIRGVDGEYECPGARSGHPGPQDRTNGGRQVLVNGVPLPSIVDNQVTIDFEYF